MFIVGRNPELSDIVPPMGEGFATISGRHLSLTPQANGGYVVRDLGSTNSTMLNINGHWQRVQEAVCDANTPIRMGQYETTVGALLQNRVSAPRSSALVPPAPPTGAVVGAQANGGRWTQTLCCLVLVTALVLLRLWFTPPEQRSIAVMATSIAGSVVLLVCFLRALCADR